MSDLLKVSIQGTMPGGEKWSINPVFGYAQSLALSVDELQATVTAINGVAVPTLLNSVNMPAVLVTGCRVEARTFQGVLEGVAEGARTSAAQGSGSSPHPFQTSIVASLRTSDSSARGKGRLYWPATSIALVDTSLKILPAAVDNFSSAFVQYIVNVRNAIRTVGGQTTANLVVWSRTSASARIVTSIRVGDIADVQRRRRDAIPESYKSFPVSAI